MLSLKLGLKIRRRHIISGGNRRLDVFDREVSKFFGKIVTLYTTNLRQRFTEYKPQYLRSRLKNRTGEFSERIKRSRRNYEVNITQFPKGGRKFELDYKFALKPYEAIHDADKPVTIKAKGKYLAIPTIELQMSHPTHTPPGPRESGFRFSVIRTKNGTMLLKNLDMDRIDYILKKSVTIEPRLRSREIADGRFSTFNNKVKDRIAKFRRKIRERFRNATRS